MLVLWWDWLGLSIARELMELMKAKYGVESRDGDGARFWFSLRLQKTKAN